MNLKVLGHFSAFQTTSQMPIAVLTFVWLASASNVGMKKIDSDEPWPSRMSVYRLSLLLSQRLYDAHLLVDQDASHRTITPARHTGLACCSSTL